MVYFSLYLLGDMQQRWLKYYVYFFKTTMLDLVLWIWPSEQGITSLKSQFAPKYQEEKTMKSPISL